MDDVAVGRRYLFDGAKNVWNTVFCRRVLGTTSRHIRNRMHRYARDCKKRIRVGIQDVAGTEQSNLNTHDKILILMLMLPEPYSAT